MSDEATGTINQDNPAASLIDEPPVQSDGHIGSGVPPTGEPKGPGILNGHIGSGTPQMLASGHIGSGVPPETNGDTGSGEPPAGDPGDSGGGNLPDGHIGSGTPPVTTP
ncbi:MAG: hypothetical protein ACJ72N_23160 [Labedaea sp.]